MAQGNAQCGRTCTLCNSDQLLKMTLTSLFGCPEMVFMVFTPPAVLRIFLLNTIYPDIKTYWKFALTYPPPWLQVNRTSVKSCAKIIDSSITFVPKRKVKTQVVLTKVHFSMSLGLRLTRYQRKIGQGQKCKFITYCYWNQAQTMVFTMSINFSWFAVSNIMESNTFDVFGLLAD